MPESFQPDSRPSKTPDSFRMFRAEASSRAKHIISRLRMMRRNRLGTSHVAFLGVLALSFLSVISHAGAIMEQTGSGDVPTDTRVVDEFLAEHHDMTSSPSLLARLSPAPEFSLLMHPTAAMPAQADDEHKTRFIGKVIPYLNQNELDELPTLESLHPETYKPVTRPPLRRKLAGLNFLAPEEAAGTEKSRFISAPLKRFRLTSGYGWRHGRPHRGVDLSAPVGTPVHAANAGRVMFAYPYYGYGNYVVIDHDNGVQTRYAHLGKILVNVGDEVLRDQMIGTIGMTGSTTGAHVHFEVVENHFYRNPMRYFVR